MDREWADLWLERGILALVLAILVFGALAFGGARQQDFAVIQGLTALTLLLWMARFWVNPSHRIQWPPICWAVVAFTILAVVRYFQADIEYVARQELIRILVYAALFFVVLNNLHRQETTRLLVWALLTLATLISMYAVFQFLTKSEMVWWTPQPSNYRGRASGTFVCPNHLAGFLELVLPLALAGLLMSKAKPVGMVFYAYFALVIVGGIAVTVSRGGYASTALALLAMFTFLLKYRNYRWLSLAALAVMIIAGTVIFSRMDYAGERFGKMFEPGQKESVTVRLRLWESTWNMWKDHPWVGVGPAHFDVRYPEYRYGGPQGPLTRPVWSHNDYLNALADWGVVGGGIIAGFLVCLTLGAAKTWKFVLRSEDAFSGKRSDRAAYVLGASVGLLALLLHSVTDFNLQIPANAILFFTLAAGLSSHLRFATSKVWFSPRLTTRVIVTLLSLAALAFLGATALRGQREGWRLTRAEQAESAAVGIAWLHVAYAGEPRNPSTPLKIGEIYRLESWKGGEEWSALAEEAIRWFAIGEKLNPYNTFALQRTGMCLDWLGRHEEAGDFFVRALDLDPHNAYLVSLMGWHEMQIEDWQAAKEWMLRAQELQPWHSYVPGRYLHTIEQRLAEEVEQ